MTRCAVSALRFQPGPLWSEETGQHTGTIVVINLSRERCSLDGYPTLTVLDARHRVLAFRIGHRGDQVIAAESPREVLLQVVGRAYFVFNKYRCDIRSTAVARYLRVSLRPSAGDSQLVRLAGYPIIDFCPGELASTTIAVSPFVSRLGQAARAR
jgi:hypothetical protein